MATTDEAVEVLRRVIPHDVEAHIWRVVGEGHAAAPAAGAVMRVELDPGGYAPDVDRQNNFWPRGSGE